MSDCDNCIMNFRKDCSGIDCVQIRIAMNKHDKQIRDEVIDEFTEWLVDKGVLDNRCICDGEITDYGKIYAKEFKQMKENNLKN